MKKKLIILFTLILVFTLAACAPSEEKPAEAPPHETTEEVTEDTPSESSDDLEKEFTLEELAKFNGKDGNKAYVAVDGYVYDVTDVPPWNGGEHNGYEAGKDLSEEIKTKSPHGPGKLEGVPIVGKLVE